MKIGHKIKQIRKRQQLTQEELADRCNLTKGFISQVERDITSPSISSLEDILSALGTNLSSFFNDQTDYKSVWDNNDYISVKNEKLGYELKWLIPNSQSNSMEPIILTLIKGGQSKVFEPFEGEDFAYILKGKATLVDDGEEFTLVEGMSFYSHGNRPHYFRNDGSEELEILWVSNPPIF